MKHILCYGDSNTWGCSPKDGSRYDLTQRWPGVLQRELGADVRIIEEGLNGRTTVFDDPLVDYDRNGMTWLPVCLATHRPLDLVVIMLGTNDLKTRLCLTPWEISTAAARLAAFVGAHGESGPDGVHPPQVLLVSPIHLAREIASDRLRDAFGQAEGYRKSLLLAGAYKNRAAELGCHFFDAAAVAEPSPLDGVHMDPQGHHALALALAAKIREILF